MDSSITIAPIDAALIAGHHACLDAVARERRWLALEHAPSLEAVQAFVAENIAQRAPHVVALDHGEVVGWCDLRRGWPASRAHSAALGIGIRASHRGRGLGQRLLQACLAAADTAGISRVELDVRADNPRAIALYERMGFLHEGRRRQAMVFDGQPVDCLMMGRVTARAPTGG